ncbi:hypothetical protein [Sphingobium sp.]|uniref:hypothetical protein n=1 Tax=Sphingobium sp. TaxID=1912891 RepID=UPI003BB4C714
MTENISYHAACLRAEEARNRLLATSQEARARIAPARLKKDAVGKVKGAFRDSINSASAKVQERPVAAGAAATAFLLFLARRPLTALLKRLYVRLTDPNRDNSESKNG